MKQLKYLFLLMLIALPFVVSEAQTKKTSPANTSPVVEILYFHGPQRCKSCVALEKAAKELVNTKFARQVKEGKVKFREINLSTKEGEKLGDKYEVAWSSLLIVRKQGKKEKFADMTDVGFRYAVKHKEKIQSMMEKKIIEFLK